MSSCKVSVVCQIVMTRFLNRLSKNLHISNFMKIGLMGAELFNDEANGYFSKYYEHP